MPITFQTSTIAVAQIFAMGTLGFYLVRKGLIQESGLKLLSYLSVNIFFPLFIFYQIITNFDAARLSNWWQFPLINIFVPSVGLLMSALVLWRRKIPYKDAFLVVSSLHNGGYIPLLLVMSLPLGALAGQVYTCVILSIIGFDIYLWSVGVWLITRGDSLHMDFKKMINPPLMAMFAAMLIILFFGPGHISVDILKPIKILGEAALGVSMIVIGGNLGISRLNHLNLTQVSGIVLIKLILMPLITVIVLAILKLNPLISLVAMIQSCMPSSITISLIARNYETKNQDIINQGIFITHLLSMITIPIFLGLYGRLFN